MTEYYKPKFYVPFMLLIFMLVTVGFIVTAQFNSSDKAAASQAPTGVRKLIACPYDDGEIPKGYDGCYWDAQHNTNGEGYSYVTFTDGTIYYGDTYFKNGKPDSNSEFSNDKGYDPNDKYLEQKKYSKTADKYHNCYNSKYHDWYHSTNGCKDSTDWNNSTESDKPDYKDYTNNDGGSDSKYTKSKDSYHNCYSSKYHDWYHSDKGCYN